MVFLRSLAECLAEGGKILIGDVAFETRTELEQCARDAGDEWDDEELYCVADELRAFFPSLRFEKVSFCAGILTI